MEKVLVHISDVSHVKPLLKDYIVQNYGGLYTYYFAEYFFSYYLFIPSSHCVMVESQHVWKIQTGKNVEEAVM
jgi:hypothetical protein